MITLNYCGPPKPGAVAQLGHASTIWAQRQHNVMARRVTHTEAHLGGPWWAAQIGSSSIVDGGVRVRTTTLNPAHWLVLQLPDTATRNTEAAREWFERHKGEDYDAMGAVGSVTPALIPHRPGKWYCTEAVAASFGFRDPHIYNPAAFVTLQFELGAVDITAPFFERTV